METAAHVSAQRTLSLQGCTDKAPSSPGRGVIEEDQGRAVGVVNTAVTDRRLQVSLLASGLDLLAKYCWFIWIMTHRDWLLIKAALPTLSL